MKKTIIAMTVFATSVAFTSCKNCVECEDQLSSTTNTQTFCNTDDVQGTQNDANANAEPGEYWVCTKKD